MGLGSLHPLKGPGLSGLQQEESKSASWGKAQAARARLRRLPREGAPTSFSVSCTVAAAQTPTRGPAVYPLFEPENV